MSSDLLDASAVLALLGNERGSDPLRQLVPGGAISAVNLAEVIEKLTRQGMPRPQVKATIDALHLEVIPFGTAEAFHTADFVQPGISLGDRACLGTAQMLGRRVVTGESKWMPVRRNVDVFLFRERR